MIQLITESSYEAFSCTLASMYKLRYRVFKERLDWSVITSADMEMDEFDLLCPAYLVQTSPDGSVEGTVRLLPTTGPTMVRDTFPMLLAGLPAPLDPQVWESSRFAIDVPPDQRKGEHGLAKATYELFAGMLEFGLARRLNSIVTVTDVRMERILKRAGWPLSRIAPPCTIGNTLALAGHLEVSADVLQKVRAAGAISGPVLWTPVLLEAA
ncbi:acyl-homoserine-lactone synthase [Bradyrhizobium neotropicale]|uniref:acyl-homoserine-lactone synthase n=1 Tax=Bradyrhizobium neotropicale TaxID=1497615 RepID=A0A176ZJ23_9BRAD|nr:acyl-homoserine-lactone synthase [Bradyrhizobium neotropicale]OAF20194.1 conjugal transfer protein TraI [Bradyrhizobium neotropicale]